MLQIADGLFLTFHRPAICSPEGLLAAVSREWAFWYVPIIAGLTIVVSLLASFIFLVVLRSFDVCPHDIDVEAQLYFLAAAVDQAL